MDALEISSQFEELLSEQFMTSKLKKMLETLAKHPKDDKAIIFVGKVQKRFNTILTSLFLGQFYGSHTIFGARAQKQKHWLY